MGTNGHKQSREANEVSTLRAPTRTRTVLSLIAKTQKPGLIQLSLIRQTTVGDEVEFDARAHAVQRSEKDGKTITLTMRSNGDFLRVDIDATKVLATTWEAAEGCTMESILRVRGVVHSLSDNNNADESLVGTVRAVELLVLSRAVDALPKTVSHGGPREKAATVSLTLQERLNNRVLDVRVAATGAIFQLLSGLNELSVEYCFAHDFKYVSNLSVSQF